MTSIRNGKLKNINKFNTGTFEKNVKYSFSAKSFKNILDLNAPFVNVYCSMWEPQWSNFQAIRHLITWTKLLLD